MLKLARLWEDLTDIWSVFGGILPLNKKLGRTIEALKNKDN